MSVAPGTRIGHYQILAPIGAGGMGEVYKATDTKLKREVALKVLPAAVATDPERLARFQREAEVLASLNHPNIAAIYGVEHEGDTHALAMEFVDGASPKGPLPFDEAWKICSQIADALEYAHERGIVHRDLKPANVKVTPDGVVKLLDFGLAKAFSNQREGQPASGENSPTLTVGSTEVGVILGTAGYMAPEQARGKIVDKRADIWAFGVVLCELLTGEHLFLGEDVTETLAHVVMTKPDLSKAPTEAHALLEACLQKDPKQRLRDIGDAKRLLGQAAPTAGPVPSQRPWVAWIAAGVLALALAGVSWIAYRATRPADPKPLVRLNLNLPTANFAISPDGTRIVYAQPSPNGPVLATRLLSESDATVLAGTEGTVSSPVFSPDGQWIGFAAGGQFKKVSVRGGAPLSLAPASGLYGAAWGMPPGARDGFIVAAFNVAGDLTRVPDTGGPAELAVTRAQVNGGTAILFPQLLPGGRALLFGAVGNDPGMYVKNLTTGKTQRVLEDSRSARYLATGNSGGHLVYVTDGTLFARPFDPDRLVLLGPPQPVLSGVAMDSLAVPILSFSDAGDLVYQAGQPGRQSWPVEWMDSSGATRPLLSKKERYMAPRFSPGPEGRYLALQTQGNVINSNRPGEVLVYDWKSDVTVTLTRPGELGAYPIWSPDGKYLAFANSKGIAWVRADGSSEPRQILESKDLLRPGSISPDGKYLAFNEINPQTSFDILVAPLDLTRPDQPVVGKPEPLVRNPGNDVAPEFSPDGKWLAYFSDADGIYKVYVRPFPGTGASRNVSVDGGTWPVWSKNGHELLFNTRSTIMTVDYRVSGDAFLASKPRLWSNAPIRYLTYPSYALHPDGKRIAMFPPEDASAAGAAPHIVFVQNFFDEVRRRAPAQ